MKRFWKRWFHDPNALTDTSIGGLLLRHGFITREQLLDAISIKTAASGEAMLGEVLIARGAITRAQLDRILALQKQERGNKVDYSQETQNLVAAASARAENLHGPLDELEDAARRFSITQAFPIVTPPKSPKH